jgi:hypothetical protein
LEYIHNYQLFSRPDIISFSQHIKARFHSKYGKLRILKGAILYFGLDYRETMSVESQFPFFRIPTSRFPISALNHSFKNLEAFVALLLAGYRRSSAIKTDHTGDPFTFLAKGQLLLRRKYIWIFSKRGA